MIPGAVFGRFNDAEIMDLVAPLRSDLGEQSPDDVFASAVWSCLVEPGDAVGGVLRAVLGPAGGLAALARSDGDVLRLLRAAGVPDAERFGLAAARERWAPRVVETRFRAALRSAAALGARLLLPGDVLWPTGLDDLGLHAPVALWIRGDPTKVTSGPAVALVGCRAASAYGEQVAAELADGLVTRGLAIHSGGAYGIDGMAHRATLAAGGTTIAVMAGGVDRFYPAGHHDLLKRVVETGAVLAESSCGMTPSRWRFLQRNRLIAALTAATVVVEAGVPSGALSTAGHAQAMDRPVGAVPGPITSPASRGCHQLIKEPGTTCITSADDVLGMIEPRLELGDAGRASPRAKPEELRVLDALSRRRARSEAEVASASGLSEGTVRGTLAVLELTGRAAERDGGWVLLAGE